LTNASVASTSRTRASTPTPRREEEEKEETEVASQKEIAHGSNPPLPTPLLTKHNPSFTGDNQLEGPYTFVETRKFPLCCHII